MSERPELHSAVVSMVSLAAGIAAKHPDMGLCQLQRLRQMGVPDHQIQTVIDIARHIRDEASERLDARFDEQAGVTGKAQKPLGIAVVDEGGACCTPTPGGQSCC